MSLLNKPIRYLLGASLVLGALTACDHSKDDPAVVATPAQKDAEVNAKVKLLSINFKADKASDQATTKEVGDLYDSNNGERVATTWTDYLFADSYAQADAKRENAKKKLQVYLTQTSEGKTALQQKEKEIRQKVADVVAQNYIGAAALKYSDADYRKAALLATMSEFLVKMNNPALTLKWTDVISLDPQVLNQPEQGNFKEQALQIGHLYEKHNDEKGNPDLQSDSWAMDKMNTIDTIKKQMQAYITDTAEGQAKYKQNLESIHKRFQDAYTQHKLTWKVLYTEDDFKKAALVMTMNDYLVSTKHVLMKVDFEEYISLEPNQMNLEKPALPRTESHAKF